MADLNKETIKQLSRLCRIHCTEEEEESLLQDLKKILNYIELLQQINTDNVPPCNQVLEDQSNVFRDDVVGSVLDKEAFLANAPSHVGGMIRVPPIIKQS